MAQSNTQALSQEIKQSAQKILKHLNEFEFDDDSQTNIKSGTEFMNLFSNLQTEESASLLQDVNKWTENRCDSYQKFEQPLLDQVEENQKIAERSTGEAIPILKDQMDEFDMKLINAKSRLSSLTDNVLRSATDVSERSKNQGEKEEIPQLQLNIPQSPVEDSNEKELSRIEYENEVIQQLRKRQEYFLDALRNFDNEIASIQEDLKNSREDAQKLEKENNKLKKELETQGKRTQLLLVNDINMQINLFNPNLEIEQSQFFDIPFDETQYTETHEAQHIETEEASTQVEIEEDQEKAYLEKLKAKMAKYELVFFSDEDAIIEPNNEYLNFFEKFKNGELNENNTIKENTNKDKLNADYKNTDNLNADNISEDKLNTDNKNKNNLDVDNKKIDNINAENISEDILSADNLNAEGSEAAANKKFQYTNHSFEPSSINSEISYEIKVNDKGEIVFDLTDEAGNSIMGNFTPETAAKMQDEIHKDIEQLISINASSSDQSNPSTNNQNKNISSQFDVSINKNPDFSQNKNLNGRVNFPLNNNPHEGPQPIVPIGIRQREDQNGNVGFRIFFRQNNDALVLDTNVKQRTNDGLIVINSPSPNILLRIQNGFSTEFVSRCRENPNLNFILRPYRPEGCKDRIVGLCENDSDSYRSNFYKVKNNAPCIWSSFPVRPPPPIYRASNRPQTNHISNVTSHITSSLDNLPPSPSIMPKDIPYFSPQQVYQMRRSNPSGLLIRKSNEQQKNGQLTRVRHSYNIPINNGQINHHLAQNNEIHPSPRRIIQTNNGRRIISPDNKNRGHTYNSMRKLNRPNNV